MSAFPGSHYSNNCSLTVSPLKLSNVDDFLKIEFDAFYESFRFIYSDRREAAYNILRQEIMDNFESGRFFNARDGEKVAGIMELVTFENSRHYKRNFYLFLKYLGLFRAFKAYFLDLMDLPRIDRRTIYIDNVAVDVENRRKGIALSLLSFAEDYARKNGKSSLRLWVATKNSEAYQLYKKIGYRTLMSRSSKIAERNFGYRDWEFMGKEIL